MRPALSLSQGTTSVDARRLTLPNGSNLTLLVRDGVVYIPNPELAKLLPSITRNVMESLRSTYSITVHHANKAEIGILKNLGILGVKAGRSLVYRAADVAKMFDHWHSPVPDYLKELCEGKVRGWGWEGVTGEGGKGEVGGWSSAMESTLYEWGGDQSNGQRLIVYVYMLDGEGVGGEVGGCDRRGCEV